MRPVPIPPLPTHRHPGPIRRWKPNPIGFRETSLSPAADVDVDVDDDDDDDDKSVGGGGGGGWSWSSSWNIHLDEMLGSGQKPQGCVARRFRS